MLSPPGRSFMAPLSALSLRRPSPTAPHMVPQLCCQGTAHGSAQSGLGQSPLITIPMEPSGSLSTMALLPLQPPPSHGPCPDLATSHEGSVDSPAPGLQGSGPRQRLAGLAIALTQASLPSAQPSGSGSRAVPTAGFCRALGTATTVPAPLKATASPGA